MSTSDTPDQTRPTAPSTANQGLERARPEDGSQMMADRTTASPSSNEVGPLQENGHGNEPGTLKDIGRVKVWFPPLPNDEQKGAPGAASGEESSGLSEVRVRGYDPEQKKEIVGRMVVKGQGDDESMPMMGAQAEGEQRAADRRSEVKDSHDRPPASLSQSSKMPWDVSAGEANLASLPPSIPTPVPIPHPNAAGKVTDVANATKGRRLKGWKEAIEDYTRPALGGLGVLVVLGLVAAAVVFQPWRTFSPQPAAFTVTGTTASVTPSSGSCGGTSGSFTFEGVITVSPASGGTVQFHWERSDGTSTAPESVTIAAGETSATVHHPWVSPAPTHPGSYWGQLVVTAPNSVTSNQATFTIPQC
jgi:hypothetical protein